MYREKRIKNTIATILFSVLWLLIVINTLPMVFMTYDDTSIQLALSGVHTGIPYPYHQFINLFLGHMIAYLYNVSSVVPWWYVWSGLCILFGVFFICWTLMRNVNKMCEAIFLICIFGMLFFVYALANISFTLAPCIFSLGIVFLFFSEEEHKWSHRFVCCGVFVLLLSYWHREDTGYVMLCYFGMGLLYYVLNCIDMNNKQKLIRFVCTFGITVLILLMTKQIDYVLKEDINPAGFTDFNEARIDYMDYPHVSYSENPEVFEQYGWDENLESLVSDWCFLDDRVTTEAFVGIYEVEGENCQTTFFTPLVSLLEGDNYAKYLTYCFVGVALLGELYICLNGLFISQINFFFMSNLGGSLILLLFLIYRGRLPLRAYLIVVMSMILISCLLMLKTRAYGEKNAKSEFVWRLSLIVLLILAIPCFLHNYDEKLVQRKLSDIEACNAIDEYMRENNQNIYITDVDAYNNINPFSQTSYNHFWWGDSTYYSDYYYRQLQMNGLTELNMETFKRDDVYFITNASNENYNDNVHRLLECLKEYGGVRVEKVDCIDGVRDVYKFIFEE